MKEKVNESSIKRHKGKIIIALVIMCVMVFVMLVIRESSARSNKTALEVGAISCGGSGYVDQYNCFFENNSVIRFKVTCQRDHCLYVVTDYQQGYVKERE